MNYQTTALWNKVFNRITLSRDNGNTLFGFVILTIFNHTVNVGNDCRILRTASFKQLGHTRQTTGNIFSFGAFSRNTSDNITGLNFSTVINGGYYYRPHLLSQVIDASGNVRKNAEKVLLRQAISSDVSADLREYMRAGVEEGTSQYAKVNGYSMGGKTGTAQKIPRGNGKYLVSWIGFVPYDDPQLVIYCIVDEPNVRDQADNRYPQWIARDILQEVLPYLGIYPDEPMNPDNEYLKMDLETAKAEVRRIFLKFMSVPL